MKLFRTDISDWRITFVDTGLNSPIGERLRRVRRFVEDEPMFLANYADVLHRRPAAGHDRAVRGEQRGGQPARRAAAVLPPRRGRRRRRPDHPGHAGAGPASVGERRLLRAPARRSSTTSTRARTSSRTRSSGWSRSAGSWPTRTRATGRPPTRSRSAPSSRRCTTAGDCPWMIWDPERSGAAEHAATATRHRQRAA